MSQNTKDTTEIFSPELEQSYRDAFTALRVRLAPDCSLPVIHKALKDSGTTVEVDEHGLHIAPDPNRLGVAPDLRSALLWATKEESLRDHFIVDGGKIRHLSEFSSDPNVARKQKLEYIETHGPEAYEQLIADSRQEPMRPGIVAHSGMSRDEWQNLSVKEKTQAISQWGKDAPQIVAQINGRRAKSNDRSA